MRAAVRAFGLVPIEQDRYEADDLIATYACQARERGADVLIISADKDLMQLIRDGIGMYDPASGEAGAKGAREERRIGLAEVQDYFGVPPEKVIDVQALAGDSTDNVPGARGIGVKTAAQLINEYGDLDTLLARAGEIKQPKRREILTAPESVDLIKVSKQLVTLVRDVALDVPLDDLGLEQPEGKTLVGFLKAMEFTTITKRAAETYGVVAEAIEADAAFLGPAGWRGRNGDIVETVEAIEEAEEKIEEAKPTPTGPRRNARYGETPQRQIAPSGRRNLLPRALRWRLSHRLTAAPIRRSRISLRSMPSLPRLSMPDLSRSTLRRHRSDPMQAELIGVSLCVKEGEGVYVPLRHRGEGAGDLFGGDALLPGQLPDDDVLRV